MRSFSFLLILCITITLIGCKTNTTALTDSQRYMDNQTGDLKKILVVAVSSNVPVRNLFEKDMATQIERHGVEVVRSLEEMPADEPIKEEAFANHFANKQIDAVLVSHIVDVEKIAEHTDGEQYDQMPQMSAYNYTYYNYYYRTWDRAAEPGHFEYAEIVRIETTLWDVETQNVIWECHSKSFHRENAKDIISDLTKLLGKTMKEDGVLQ